MYDLSHQVLGTMGSRNENEERGTLFLKHLEREGYTSSERSFKKWNVYQLLTIITLFTNIISNYLHITSHHATMFSRLNNSPPIKPNNSSILPSEHVLSFPSTL